MTATLDPALRKQLETAVREARRVGEKGARAALGALAVDAPRPHGSMTEDERALRLKLRAHGRQLGDKRDRQSGTQKIERLVHEVAYEHWHRMLFARFLAENGLLIEPQSRVAVSLEECRELAREGRGSWQRGDSAGHGRRRPGVGGSGPGADGWEVAEAFASRMLPQIFRPDDPALAVTLAPETRQKLERLVGDLPKVVFTATDSLGWTYQFWQTDRKDQVNKAGGKIGADELPAVTQLFTEPYMVRFLFHNTVGAWRAGKLLAARPELARDAASEAELAQAARIAPAGGVDGYDFEYLRFVREPPAAEEAPARSEAGTDPSDAPFDAGAPNGPGNANIPSGPGDANVRNCPGDANAKDALDDAGVPSGPSRATAPDGLGDANTPNGLGDASALDGGDELANPDASTASGARLAALRPAGPWRPAAGAFAGWPDCVADLRVLDPCCGSGHFLVEGLELLARLRMEEEGLAVEEAVRAVLRDNLSGLELDPRCTQIAAFSVALAAWKMVGRPIDLPPLRVACSGLAPSAPKQEWRRLADGDQRLEGALDKLYELFGDAPTLGSLIDPAGLGEDLFQVDYETAEHLLTRAVARERTTSIPPHAGNHGERLDVHADCESAEQRLKTALARGRATRVPPSAGRDDGERIHSLPDCETAEQRLPTAVTPERMAGVSAPADQGHDGHPDCRGGAGAGDEEDFERAVAAQGMARAAKLLAGRYDLVITNVPYLARGKQAERLRKLADASHPEAKSDLATMFVSRILEWLAKSGAQAVVVPQNWLFLTSYRKLRERLLQERTWRLVARLGEHAFESTAAAGAFGALTVLSARKPDDDWYMTGIDVSAQRGEKPIRAREKAELLEARGSRVGESESLIKLVTQVRLLANPDSEILLDGEGAVFRLRDYAHTHQGISTADARRFILCSWETEHSQPAWLPYQMAPEATQCVSGCHSVLRWEGGKGSLHALETSYVRGTKVWGRDGLGIGVTGSVPRSKYVGTAFGDTCAVVVPNDGDRDLGAIHTFVFDKSFPGVVRGVDQALSVTEGSFGKVPFDLDRWSELARHEYPNGLPEPYSDDPTQWLFHGHPCGSVIWDEEAKWTAHGALRTDASVLQVAVARLLGYRWPAELDPEMRLAEESREWVRRCGELQEFADEDGIVCLNAAPGELPAADRLRSLLAAAYGDGWSSTKEGELLAAVAAAANRKTAASLEEWLRDQFFAQHLKLFHNRPFLWHIWDGRSDGFQALVNCHRLCAPDGEGRRTLQALAYRHLGEWIRRQQTAQSENEEGADARLAAAQDLQSQLERILEGEPPCDIFVRWRALHDQPIGWEPNLDDGVRLNIRPFLRAELQSGGRKGAGILRVKPNINWSKDRGKEPQSERPREDFPWFWSCPGQASEADRTDYAAPPEAAYDGNRWNDLHYTRAAKEAARARQEACER